jgi:ABC-2 type transport system permease protein
VAQLEDRPALPDIPATTQLAAIAWLRWRIFVNGFIRRQTGPRKVAGLILTILLRVLIWPVFAMMAIGPAIGAGFFAWMIVSQHHPQRLIPLLAGIAILWQFVAVNGISLAATLSSFDPASLLRYPLRFGRYFVLRLMLGLMTPSTIIGCLALFASVIGIGVADHSLVPAALVVLAIYASMNIFLARMIAAWLERWLATRRAREVFGGLMAVFFIAIQFLNFRHAGSRGQVENSHWLLNFIQGSNRFLGWMPPGFATNSILLAGHPFARLAQFVALLAWTVLFFAGFAYRLRRQFLGEYLSDGAPRSSPSASASIVKTQPRAAVVTQAEPARTLLSPTIQACLRKEWVYLSGNGGQLIGLVMPLIFVAVFSRGMLARHPSYLLSGAVGYALMGPMAALYNIFGADGTGMQLYLLAPVRLRDVVIAKNIASMTLLVVEATLAWIIVRLLASTPIPLAVQVSSWFWIVFILFLNLTLGTLRSVQAPRKIVPGEARKMRPPGANKTSGLLVIAILFTSILLQVPVTLLSRHFHNLWLGAVIFAPLAATAIVVYGMLLNNADSLIFTHRDLFAEELCGD